MRLITALIFATWVLATEDTGYGTFSASLIGDEANYGNLMVKKSVIFVNERFSIFNYDGNKTIQQFQSPKLLNVSKNGLLIMIAGHGSDFRVEEESKFGKKRKISYQGDNVFEICRDNLIRYKSSCEGAKKIAIFYIDFAQYR